MKRKREIATGLLILAIATVFGQETPPPAQTPPAEKAADKSAQPKEEPKANVVLGWSGWGLSGNENKFRQYATPPKDFFLRELSFAPSFQGRHDLSLSLKAPGEDDYRMGGVIRLNNGTTYLEAGDNRNRFYGSDPSVLTASQRHWSEGSVRQKLTPDLAVTFRSSFDQEDKAFPAPLDALHQRTRIWNAAAQGSLWKDGFVDLSYTDWRYWDRTNVLPDTNMQRWGIGAMHQFGDFFSLNATFARSLIRQPQLTTGDNTIESWSVGGDLLLGDDTNVVARFRSEKLDLPTVQNAYDRSRQMTQGRIIHRFGAGWTGQFGYTRLALERVNDSHTFVDVPKWHTFDFQLSGKLSPSLRITARGARATMDGGATMETEDPRALYWRNRWSGEVKLDAIGDQMNGYVVFGLHDDRNDVRDVRVRNQSLTFGADFQVQPNLDLYFESSFDMWSGITSDPEAPNLNSYFPDGTVFTVGGNWTISDKLVATGNLSLFNTSNDNPLGLPGGNVNGRFFTTSLRYQTPHNVELGLTFAPWQYVDKLYGGQGYSTGLVQLTAKARF